VMTSREHQRFRAPAQYCSSSTFSLNLIKKHASIKTSGT
jgi:hypothetical protein